MSIMKRIKMIIISVAVYLLLSYTSQHTYLDETGNLIQVIVLYQDAGILHNHCITTVLVKALYEC